MINALTLALLSDYGYQDAYTGILHAVALSRLTPQAKQLTHRLDLTHGIPAFDIRAGAWSLLQTLPYLPAHAVCVAIVDPYVGAPNQCVALVYRPSFQQVFLAPDNGLLNPLLGLIPEAQVFSLSQERLQSYGWYYTDSHQSASAGKTFQGRDLYVPVACEILNAWARQERPFFLNEAQAYETTFKVASPFPPSASREVEGFKAHILLQDTFGNWITTLPSHWIPPEATQLSFVYQNEVKTLPLASYFAEIQTESQVFAIRGSHGFIEIASFKSNSPLTLERDGELCINFD